MIWTQGDSLFLCSMILSLCKSNNWMELGVIGKVANRILYVLKYLSQIFVNKTKSYSKITPQNKTNEPYMKQTCFLFSLIMCNLKVGDLIDSLIPNFTLSKCRFWYQVKAHIFLINILKLGIPNRYFNEEIIKKLPN